MVLNIQYTFPKADNAQSIRAKLMNAAKWINHEQLLLINDYLWTWKHRSQIQVSNKYGYKGDEVYAAINIDDPTRVFWYVEQGTSVRYATMTPDFVPKTAPRRIKSVRGQGGLAYVNRKRPHKPGIEGRHVLDEISKVLEPKIIARVKSALSEIKI